MRTVLTYDVLKQTGCHVRDEEVSTGNECTESGRLAILYNAMLPFGDTLRKLLMDLKEPYPDHALVNGRIWLVTTGFVDVLDAIAVHCDSRASYDDLVNLPISFLSYPFPQPSIRSFMPKLQNRIKRRTYREHTLFEIAFGLKDGCLFTADVTRNVFMNDSTDVWNDATGFVHHVLVPTYNDIVEMFEQFDMQSDDKIKMDFPLLDR